MGPNLAGGAGGGGEGGILPRKKSDPPLEVFLCIIEQFLIEWIQRIQSNPLSNQNSKQLHKAREHSREQVTIGFRHTPDWLSTVSGASFLSQSLNIHVVMQYQSKCKLFSMLK